MRMLTFSSRTAREILRDPLNLAFGIGFPVVLLCLMSAIQANIPVPIFELTALTPGVAVFGLSFLTLFGATLVSRDRETALLERLYTTPMTAADFIFGYALPLLPMALVQSALTYLVAVLLGLSPSADLVWAVLLNLPAALFFIALGLLCGSVLSVKQVGGLCGALLTNLTAWLSGAWFDLELVGGAFRAVADALPFSHAVEIGRAVLAGDPAAALPHLVWALGYAAVFSVLAVVLFLSQMRRR